MNELTNNVCIRIFLNETSPFIIFGFVSMQEPLLDIVRNYLNYLKCITSRKMVAQMHYSNFHRLFLTPII